LIGNRGHNCSRQGRSAWRTKSLALELASRGITVNAVAPGIITSPMSESCSARTYRSAVPMKRTVPEEVADWWRSSPGGRHLGQIINNGAMI
jgi:3-oxoacyl-[acyl-carrier protein] reductase